MEVCELRHIRGRDCAYIERDSHHEQAPGDTGKEKLPL